MSDEYPSHDQLESILRFQGSPAHLVDYVNNIWWHEGFIVKPGVDRIFKHGVKRLYLSTWGWSGNEDIISELQKTMFWMLYWRRTERGGHYEFEVPLMKWQDLTLPLGAILDDSHAEEWLHPATRRQLLEIIKEARETALPIAYIEKKIKE